MKDAEGVKNVASIVKQFINEKPVVFVSAMGKVTNALEEICKSFVLKSGNTNDLLESLKKFHFDIALNLLPSNDSVFDDLEKEMWIGLSPRKRSIRPGKKFNRRTPILLFLPKGLLEVLPIISPPRLAEKDQIIQLQLLHIA